MEPKLQVAKVCNLLGQATAFSSISIPDDFAGINSPVADDLIIRIGKASKGRTLENKDIAIFWQNKHVTRDIDHEKSRIRLSEFAENEKIFTDALDLYSRRKFGFKLFYIAETDARETMADFHKRAPEVYEVALDLIKIDRLNEKLVYDSASSPNINSRQNMIDFYESGPDAFNAAVCMVKKGWLDGGILYNSKWQDTRDGMISLHKTHPKIFEAAVENDFFIDKDSPKQLLRIYENFQRQDSSKASDNTVALLQRWKSDISSLKSADFRGRDNIATRAFAAQRISHFPSLYLQGDLSIQDLIADSTIFSTKISQIASAQITGTHEATSGLGSLKDKHP